MQVEVITRVHHAAIGSQQTTNTFHFTFKLERPVRKQVMPRLYDEAMKVLARVSKGIHGLMRLVH